MTTVTIELPDELVKNLDLKQLSNEFVAFVLSKNKPLSEEVSIQLAADKKTIAPITQSLIGLLANSNLDEADYKKYLEDKYL